MLSNGLENAIKAVSAVLDETLRKVYIDCHVDRNKLLIMIENVYSGELLMDDGVPTTKSEGHWFGCRSILATAERRKGFCTFKANDGIFTLRVVLPMDKMIVGDT